MNAFDNTGESRATVVVAFSAGNSAKARSIAITEDATPPLRAGASGTNQVPTVLIIDGTRVDDVRVYDDEITPCLKQRMGTGGNNVPFVAEGEQMQVRRLTPIECERLMGWPDNHTLYRADGKTNSDTARYKMCGNGVASPVAQWIAEQINQVERGV